MGMAGTGPNGREHMVVKRLDTRQLLVESMIELASTMPFDKITIKEITDNCGVSQRTFYNYFTDKYDLIAWRYSQSVGESFEKTMRQGTGYYEMQLRCILTMDSVSSYFTNIAKNTHGVDSFKNHMLRYNCELFGAWVAEKTGAAGIDGLDPHLRFSIRHYQSWAIDAMKEWLAQGRPASPEVLARWITDDMPDDLKPYLL